MEQPIASKDERMWAMFAHLSALLGFVFPFGNIIGPVVIWAIKKDQMPLVDDQGKESINCQISFTIYMLVAFLLVFVLVGFLILPLLALVDLILVIIAGIKANDGERYRYPLIFRFVK